MTGNSSSDQAADTDHTSYTSMATGDVEAIGAYCQLPDCHQLDFLPFRCQSCKGKFCLDHRSESAHKCSHEGAWAKSRHSQLSSQPDGECSVRPTIKNHEWQCSHPQCKTLIDTPLAPGIKCPECAHKYCLKHRMRGDHDCINAAAQKQTNDRRQGVADALSRLRAWGEAKRTTSMATKPAVKATAPLSRSNPKQEAAVSQGATAGLSRFVSSLTNNNQSSNKKSSPFLAINAMKKSAKGDAKIAMDKRVYVHLSAVAEGPAAASSTASKEPTDVFYSKDWSIGKVLDAAAKSMMVNNLNNRAEPEEQRLRMFHIEGGRVLPFSEIIGKEIKSGDTLVLLRGIGADSNEA